MSHRKRQRSKILVVISFLSTLLERMGSPNQKDRLSNMTKGDTEAVKRLSRCEYTPGCQPSQMRPQSLFWQTSHTGARGQLQKLHTSILQRLILIPVLLLFQHISLGNKQDFVKNYSPLPTEIFEMLNLFWNWTGSHGGIFYWQLFFKQKYFLPIFHDLFLLTLPAHITGLPVSSFFPSDIPAPKQSRIQRPIKAKKIFHNEPIKSK